MKRVKQKIKQAGSRIAAVRRDYFAARPHRSFRKTKKPRETPVVAPVGHTVTSSFIFLWREKRLFGLLAVFYILVTGLFVGGVAQADFLALRDATLDVFGGSVSSLQTNYSLLLSAMTGAFSVELTQAQQIIALLIGALFWLALIWALRMRFADHTIKVRDALYSGSAPLVAYTILAAVIVAQLAPAGIGLFVFNTAQSGNWLQSGVEVMLFAVAAFLLCCLSIYWLTSTFFALIIVTLPHMYPWQALRIASELSVGRRVRILLHLCAMATVVVASWAVVLFAMLVLDSWLRLEWLPLVPVTVQVLSALSFVYIAVHSYKLYRSVI